MENDLLLVPEPKTIKFEGRWIQFDGFENFPGRLADEYLIPKGSWRFEHVNNKTQTIKIINRKVLTSGDINIAFASFLQLLMNKKGFLPEVEIEEEVNFEFRGFHLDIARGGVPNITYFKKLLKFMFLMKYNKLGIYFEDLYPWKSFPKIGLGRGRLSMDEWNQILELAKVLGIDVFPSLELLGHMEHFLRMDEYRGLGEMWWTNHDDCLDASNPKAIKLAMDLLKDVLETSPSKLILLGGDETWSLGRGRSLDEKGVFEGPKYFTEHYQNLINLTRSFEKTPILWGDMLTGMYLTDRERKFWSSVVRNEIWDEAIIANWDYEPLSEKHFRDRIKEIGHLDKQIACPALDNWGTFYPDFEPALKNISSFLKAAKNEKLKGYMITAWGDMGQECLFSYLYPLILASADIFSDERQWPEKFSLFFDEDLNTSMARFDAGKMKCAPMIRNVLYKSLQHLDHRRELRNGWREEMTVFLEKYKGKRLSNDMSLIYSLIRVCLSLDSGSFDKDYYLETIKEYENLWISERKIEGFANVVSRLLGSWEIESMNAKNHKS